MNAFDTIVVTDRDIVCGRGKGFENLVANQTFRRIIDENASLYSSRRKNRTEKSILIRLIAHQLKEKGMRFVKRTQNGWKSLDEKKVFLKIGHALRDVAPLQTKSKQRIIKRAAQFVKVPKMTCSMIELLHKQDHRPQCNNGSLVSFSPSSYTGDVCDFNLSCAYALQQSDDNLARKSSIDKTIFNANSRCFGSMDSNVSKVDEVQPFPGDTSWIYQVCPINKHDPFDFDAELRNIFSELVPGGGGEEAEAGYNLFAVPILDL